MLNFYKLQTVKFLEINWLSQNLVTARLKNFLAGNLTLDYYNKLATMHCNRFSTILYIICYNSLITLMKSGISKKYQFVKNITESFTLFVLCFLYVLFILQTTLVLKKNIKSFFDPDNYRRYCGDSHLRYYDFSPFLLLETPGFWSFCGLCPLDPLQGSALGTLQRSPDPQLARATTVGCRAHSMTSSLTQQTYGVR